MTVSTLVIGGGGLLGSALLRRFRSRPGSTLVTQPVRWADEASSLDDLAEGIRRWLAVNDADSFQLLWAAGAAVTSATRAQLDGEVSVFTRFLAEVSRQVLDQGSAASTSIFFASSAGGVYAGADHPPFTELTETRAMSPYGEAKLAMEKLVSSFAQSTGIRVLICRISNLYGPGQKIDKPQGFVSQLCKSMLSHKPMAVYVSLDTMRDYIFADDAAKAIDICLDRMTRSDFDRLVVVKNIASHEPTTLGHILHEARLVFKRKPEIILAWSAMAAGQVRDLRIGSVVWPDLNDLPRRTLIVGLAETKASMELTNHRKGFETQWH